MNVIRELVEVKGWLGNVLERKMISSRGMYIRSIADIPKLYEIRQHKINRGDVVRRKMFRFLLIKFIKVINK